MPVTTAIPTLADVKTSASLLKNEDQISLFHALHAAFFGRGVLNASLNDNIRERRFSKGLKCVSCADTHVVRNGKVRGQQRYLCRACGQTFGDLSATPLSNTRYPEKWSLYLECMVQGLSIRESAELVGIAVSTSFMWRHKVLNAIRGLDTGMFEGILEVDETYQLHSEKGSRNIVGRKPRKRGGTSPKRGISNDQDCIVVARDRTGRLLAMVGSRGRLSTRQALVIFDDKVADVTTLCTDAHGTWRSAAGQWGIDHVELNASKGERVKKGIYHIQHVNSFHSHWKRWMDRFQGVASKFLNNYLAWFCFLETHGKETERHVNKEFLMSACLGVSRDTFESIRQTTFVLPA